MALDQLEIEISAKSNDGYRSLNNLIGKLESMNDLLKNIDLSGLKDLNNLLKTDITKYATGIKTVRSSIVALSKVESKNLKTLKADLEDLAKADLSGLEVLKHIDFSGISKATSAVKKLNKATIQASQSADEFTIHRWTDELPPINGSDEKQTFTYDNDNYQKAQEKARKDREKEAKQAETLVKGTAMSIAKYKKMLERKIDIPKIDVSSLEEAEKQLKKWQAAFDQRATAVDNKEAMNIAPTQNEMMKLVEASKYVEALENAIEGLSKSAEEVNLDSINESINGMAQNGEQAMRGVGESIKSGLKGAFNGTMIGISKVLTSIPKIVNGLKAVGRYMLNLLGVAKKVVTAFGTVVSKIGSMAGLLRKGSGSSDMFHMSFSKGLKTLMRYGLGIRSTFVLINKLRSAMKEGFKALAVYSSETNTAISKIMTALNGIKGSLATAFNPILTAVEPILTKFINLLSNAFTKVGEFFSALTGKSMSIKAIATPVNYAQSLDTSTGNAKDNLGKSADNAKKLAKELSVLPFDELNQLNGDKDSSGSSGSGSGSGGNSGSQTDFVATFTDIPVSENIKEFVEKLKKAWEKADFTEIGGMLGQKLADALDKIPWDKIQNNAKKIGKSIATLINGFVETEGLPEKIGSTIGNVFKTALETARSFVENLHWKSLGTALANGMKSFFSTYRLSDVGATIGTAITGALDFAITFAKDFIDNGGLDTLLNEAVDGINNFITSLKTWIENNGATVKTVITTFVTKLCDKIKEVKWYDLGQAFGDLLNSIPWGTVLTSTVQALWSAFTGLISGLWNSGGVPGKIAAALSSVFLAVKVGDILGITTLVGAIGKFIAGRFMLKTTTDVIASGVAKGMGQAVATAATETATSGSIAASATSIGTFLGGLVSAGFAVAVEQGIELASRKIAELGESARGGNEIITSFGAHWDDFLNTLGKTNGISSTTMNTIWAMKETLEKTGMSSDEMRISTQKLVEQLFNSGVSYDSIQKALEGTKILYGSNTEMINYMEEAIAGLEGKTSSFSEATNLSGKKVSDVWDDMRSAIIGATAEGERSEIVMEMLLEQLGDTTSTEDAQEAFERLSKILSSQLGISIDEAKNKLMTGLPESLRTSTKELDNVSIKASNAGVSIGGLAQRVAPAGTALVSLVAGLAKTSSGFKGVGSDAKREMEGVRTATEKNVKYAKQEFETGTATIKRDVDTNIGGANKAFTDKFKNIGKVTYDKMSYAQGIVYKMNNLMKDSFSNTWNNIGSSVSQKMTSISAYVQSGVNNIKNSFNSISSSVSNAFSNMYTYGRNAAISLANGLRSVHVPAPHITMNSSASAGSDGSYSYSWDSSVSWYRRGGFPVGEIWGMNESGNPEMVGRLGGGNNNTAVANNAIIVDAIQGGVENAMNRFAANFLPQLNNNGGQRQVVHSHVYLDKRQIAEAIDEVKDEDKYRFAY